MFDPQFKEACNLLLKANFFQVKTLKKINSEVLWTEVRINTLCQEVIVEDEYQLFYIDIYHQLFLTALALLEQKDHSNLRTYLKSLGMDETTTQFNNINTKHTSQLLKVLQPIIPYITAFNLERLTAKE